MNMNRLDSHGLNSGCIRMEMNILGMTRGDQRFLFFYDKTAESRTKLHEIFTKFAEHPDIDFSKADEALLSRKAEEQEQRYLPKDAA